ncbi:hypothetical protein GQ457_03G017810 [Hibiscus cannabinus]
MEPSEMFGAAEECHSNESGWTMYIGEGETQSEADQDCAHASATETDAKHGAEPETDDSMASDASSGPNHQGHQFCSKHGEDEEDGPHYCYSEKKAKKPTVGKQKLEMKRKQDKDEKQETTFNTKESSTRSPSGSYAKKDIWFGKRK